MDPVAFHARVLATADAEGRLPLASQPEWEIFPFEPAGLRARPLDPLTLPEPPRSGEGGVGCRRCADPLKGGIWADEHWVVLADPAGVVALTVSPRAHHDLDDLDDDRAAELGVLVVRATRALQGLGGVGRVHVYKWGDGGAHLHLGLWARPAGMLQLRGSNLALWEEMLPRIPEDELVEAWAQVASALAAWRGEDLTQAGRPR